MIQITDKTQCCGCTACYSVCPKNCISMKMDEEGFLYPAVDQSACIDCHACEKVCPMLNVHKKETADSSVFAGMQYRKAASRKTSTAGGAFSAVADYLMENQAAVVYAVGYTDMVVCHKEAVNPSQLEEMRGSKYVQSTLNDTFRQIKVLLKQGNTVLYVCTPCQVHGLKNYVGDHELLWTMDLLCLGVTSPGLFAEWIEYLKTKYKSSISYVRFRDKSYGYATPNVRVIFENGKKIEQTYDAKVHANLFFKGYYNVRPSCYECGFREVPRASDFTLGDFVDIGNYDKAMNDNLGTTRIWIHSEKGKEVWNAISGDISSVVLAENTESICGGGRRQVPVPQRRTEFFSDVQSMDYASLIAKWQPNTVKTKCVNLVRRTLNKVPFGRQASMLIRKLMVYKYHKKVNRLNKAQ